MKSLNILLGVSAVAVLGAASLAGAFLLRDDSPTSQASGGEDSLPSSGPAESAEMAKSWQTLSSSGDSVESEKTAMSRRWQELGAALKKIYPEAPGITDSTGANEALEKARAWVEERGKLAAESRTAGADLARDSVLSEITSLRTDLETLRKFKDAPLSAKLKALLILGGDRSGPKGLNLVWIPDPTKGSAAGFWAAKRETTLAQFKDVAGSDPASAFRKPAAGRVDEDEIERRVQAARVAKLAGTAAANREAAGLVFDKTVAPGLRNQLRTQAQQQAQQAGAGFEKFPTDLANLSNKDDSQPFINKLQQADLPNSDWKYRLPTQAEWALLQGKVDGIGTPDLSEWLYDSPNAVDRNWKSEQASSPPAPGTVGFRVVLAGSQP